jgi:hypothetical protein
MSGNERTEPKAGPFGNLSQAYFSGLDLMAKRYEPAFRGVGRWNLEMFGLMSRRAQAWLEVPARLSTCRTPQDLMREQIQFWQSATRDYVESGQRLSAALGSFVAPTGLNGLLNAHERDYISFPEGEGPAETSATRHNGRRAA